MCICTFLTQVFSLFQMSSRQDRGKGKVTPSSSRGRGSRLHPAPPRASASPSTPAPSHSDNVPERELQRRDEVQLEREMQQMDVQESEQASTGRRHDGATFRVVGEG